MSADFRFSDVNIYNQHYETSHNSSELLSETAYGLSEIFRDSIKESRIVACPGCYPTSVLLQLIPLIRKNIISTNNMVIDSKSGYSGAGRSVHKKYKDKNLYESLSAYGVGFHRHNSEIEQTLKEFTNKKINFSSLFCVSII